MNIYLCGFMGCGKSTIGKILASELGVPFIDLDTYIEEKEKMKIPEIFSNFGEKHFRKLETTALRQLAWENAVIATGGGALVNHENKSIAKKNGFIVFINTSFKTCYQRIAGDESRPIAKSKTKHELFSIFKIRYPFYATFCDLEIDGDDSPFNITNEIKKSLPLK